MNIDELAQDVEPLYHGADPAHDFSHIMRVFNLARVIGEKENARMEILLPAALLHDVGCTPKMLGGDSNKASIEIATGFLEKEKFSSKDIGDIVYAVEVHGFSKHVEPDTLEARVLQDADRLDALGAVGIARTFQVGGSLGRPMYHPRDPFCMTREPDDRKWNLDHFTRKLLTLETGMHTDTAREMAQERTLVLKKYLEDLRSEIL